MYNRSKNNSKKSKFNPIILITLLLFIVPLISAEIDISFDRPSIIPTTPYGISLEVLRDDVINYSLLNVTYANVSEWWNTSDYGPINSVAVLNGYLNHSLLNELEWDVAAHTFADSGQEMDIGSYDFVTTGDISTTSNLTSYWGFFSNVNITNSITLNSTTIFDWGDVVNSPNFLSFLLANGSTVLTGDWDAGGFTITSASADFESIMVDSIAEKTPGNSVIFSSDIDLEDNKKIYFGTDQDTSDFFNTTDRISNLEVGSTANYYWTNFAGYIFDNNLTINGSIFSSNTFIPQYIFVHNDATISLITVSVWRNITFDQEATDIKFGIDHVFNNNLNYTFTINQDGIYEIEYNFNVIDTSVSASDINIAGRVIYSNGTEIIGSVFETDIIKQNVESDLSHFLMVGLRVDDVIVFQFVADNVNVEISTHGSFGDHPQSATIKINKVANL